MLKIKTNSAEETEKLGRLIGESLIGGEIIAMTLEKVDYLEKTQYG